ncbi:hypothetical protein XELAEV_18030007mg [Xenopus laevis]|uniref:Uncharacterized protein n=1 Tax=Xenopus laevis TaxID=8355 RepID=A0A974HIB9_XENLA|nr:hypothetical protein XELAEV_18030007mg [Xenopus laevis]
MSANFMQRGYDQVVVNSQKKKVKEVQRVDLLKGKLQVKSIIHKLWEILQKNCEVGMLFKNKPLLSYKGSRNLGDMLVKAHLVQSRNKQPTFFGNPRKGTYPCLTCGCCSSIIKGESFNHPSKVSKHFKEQGHNSKQLRWMVLQIVDTPSRGGNYNRLLLQKETMWIDKLIQCPPWG